jgi:hypothetical protein
MPEATDVYCDQFQMNIGPFGSTLNFSLSSPTPPAPGSPPQAERLATVRMSLEHMKVITFILRRQILEYERNSGVGVSLPSQLLNSLRISPEDWESFWRH